MYPNENHVNKSNDLRGSNDEWIVRFSNELRLAKIVYRLFNSRFRNNEYTGAAYLRNVSRKTRDISR